MKPIDLSQFKGITPGPWEVRNNHGWACVVSHNGSYVAKTDCSLNSKAPQDFARSQLDARAIAAVPDLLAELAALRASFAELAGALQSCERVFTGWLHDADPHGDLKPGESAERDAAQMMLDMTRKALASHSAQAIPIVTDKTTPA